MTKKTKKQDREAAIRSEEKRRAAERTAESPITRDQMLSLIEFVGSEIMSGGHKQSFEITQAWAKIHSTDMVALSFFLEKQKIKDDWDLLTSGDPFHLFGPSKTRATWMPLEHIDLVGLLNWLEEKVPEHDCDHQYTLTLEYLSKLNVETPVVLAALMALGGGCDCEVMYNVETDGIYLTS